MKAKFFAGLVLTTVMLGATAKFGLSTQALAQINKSQNAPQGEAATRFGAAIESELATRSRQLDSREAELKNREALLKAAEVRLDAHIQSLKDQEAAVKAIIEAKTNMEDMQYTKLALVYGGMKPKVAGALMSRLEPELQYEIARRMKDYVIAPVMANMDPDKAAKLTQLLTEKTPTPRLITPEERMALSGEAVGPGMLARPTGTPPVG